MNLIPEFGPDWYICVILSPHLYFFHALNKDVPNSWLCYGRRYFRYSNLSYTKWVHRRSHYRCQASRWFEQQLKYRAKNFQEHPRLTLLRKIQAHIKKYLNVFLINDCFHRKLNEPGRAFVSDGKGQGADCKFSISFSSFFSAIDCLIFFRNAFRSLVALTVSLTDRTNFSRVSTSTSSTKFTEAK